MHVHWYICVCVCVKTTILGKHVVAQMLVKDSLSKHLITGQCAKLRPLGGSDEGTRELLLPLAHQHSRVLVEIPVLNLRYVTCGTSYLNNAEKPPIT